MSPDQEGWSGTSQANNSKAEYASVPLFILSLAIVKLSISAFIIQLSPDSTHLRINSAHQIIVGLWLISATLCSLFQCALPTPWDYGSNARCIDRVSGRLSPSQGRFTDDTKRAWWVYVAVLNIVTEIWVVMVYFLIIWNLQTSISRKAVILSIFSTRLLLVTLDNSLWNSL